MGSSPRWAGAPADAVGASPAIPTNEAAAFGVAAVRVHSDMALLAAGVTRGVLAPRKARRVPTAPVLTDVRCRI
jgi:hypothetical protein